MITVILLSLFAVALSAQCDNAFNCPDCVKCASISQNDDNTLAVTLDFSKCKSSALSWACVRGQTVGIPTCGGASVENTPLGYKCDDLTEMTFNLPAGSTSVKVQVHDGQNNGNFDCGGSAHPNCCGGSNGGGVCQRTGVCQLDIDLSTCPGCTKDEQCSKLNDASTCTVGKCSHNLCVPAAAPSTTQCRASSGDLCDAADFCDGQTRTCVDAVQPKDTVCRAQDGLCDAPDVCDGTTKGCADGVQPDTYRCGLSDGTPCDADDYCDGTTKSCADALQPKDTVCREASDLCDVVDKCDGTTRNCPDGLKPKDTLCRIADPNLLCDNADFCSGDSKVCVDTVKPKGFGCRASRDNNRCDPEDKCDGTTKDCVDVLSTTASFMKCGQTYDYCGPLDVNSPTFRRDAGINNGNGQNLVIDCPTSQSISIGTDATFVKLPYPACVQSCIPKTCVSGQDISNFETATCVYSANGNAKYYLTTKYDGFNTGAGTANQQSCQNRQPTSTTVNLCP